MSQRRSDAHSPGSCGLRRDRDFREAFPPAAERPGSPRRRRRLRPRGRTGPRPARSRTSSKRTRHLNSGVSSESCDGACAAAVARRRSSWRESQRVRKNRRRPAAGHCSLRCEPGIRGLVGQGLQALRRISRAGRVAFADGVWLGATRDLMAADCKRKAGDRNQRGARTAHKTHRVERSSGIAGRSEWPTPLSTAGRPSFQCNTG